MPSLPEQANAVRAWAKPLKNGTVQYYARVAGHERIMGAALHAEQAHDYIVDYVSDLLPEDCDWDIEWKGQG